jgi:hypothetical protein
MRSPNQGAAAIRRVLENPEKNFARSERFARREPSLRAQTSPLQHRPALRLTMMDDLNIFAACHPRGLAVAAPGR